MAGLSPMTSSTRRSPPSPASSSSGRPRRS